MKKKKKKNMRDSSHFESLFRLVVLLALFIVSFLLYSFIHFGYKKKVSRRVKVSCLLVGERRDATMTT